MRAYSPDLRRKIVDAVERGVTKTEVARTFSVSRSSVKRYVKMDLETGSLEPSKPPGPTPKIDDTAEKLLESDVEERPAKSAPLRPWPRDATICFRSLASGSPSPLSGGH